MSHSELYNILGVEKTASSEEIKRAYLKKALKCHPDKNQGQETEEFKKINHAQEILLNVEKRAIYDRYGEKGLEERAQQKEMEKQMNMIKFSQSVTLEQYFSKQDIEVKVPAKRKCQDCNATGFKNKITKMCRACHGQGFKIVMMPFPGQVECSACRGAKIDRSNQSLLCDTCHGKRYFKEQVTHMMPCVLNQLNRFELEDESYGVVFELIPSKEFYIHPKIGQLAYTMELNFSETICGFRRMIQHPSGTNLFIVAEPGFIINPKNKYLIEGYGMDPAPLILIFKINYPTTISDQLEGRYVFNFASMEKALGKRLHPNIKIDNVNPEHIFYLKNLKTFADHARNCCGGHGHSHGHAHGHSHGPQGINLEDLFAQSETGGGMHEGVSCQQQ